ncbi:MAG: hypothetical protein P8184_03470 [Calditrichia bacterium]
MKPSMKLIPVLILGFFLLAWSNDQAQERKVNWDAFSKNLVMALATPNEGLQQSAMQMIIRYSDNLNVDGAIFDIVRIFRNHKNPQVRRLAMVTIYKMQHGWAMDFLKRNLKFEKDETIRKHCCCMVNAYYYSQKVTPAEKPVPSLITGIK